MKKLPITKKYLLKQYKIDVDKLLDDCEWVDYIDGETLCWLVAMVCRKKGLNFDSKVLYSFYMVKIKSLKLTKNQWHEQYGNWETGVPKLIDIIYKIIENKFGSIE